MEMIGQLTAVSGVLVLLLAVLWWLRRRGYARMTAFPVLARGNCRRLERLERVALSPQHTLHLVRLGDRALLVAASPGGCSLLESLPAGALDPMPREAVR